MKSKQNHIHQLYSGYFSRQVRYRSLVRTGGGQEAQQQSEERWKDLTKSSGGVGHHDLPHVQGGLSDHQLGVGAAHVEAGEDTVTALRTESSDDSLERGTGQLTGLPR